MNVQQQEALSNIESHRIPEDAESMTNEDWLSAKNELQMFLFARGAEEEFNAWIENNSDAFNTFYQQYFTDNKEGLFNWYRSIHNGDISGDSQLESSWEQFRKNDVGLAVH